MIRALVFGGTGMLGRAVVHEARRRGHTALGLAHGQGDVTDGDRTRYWARRFRPQVVLNCAAFTRVDDCESRRDHAFAVNGEGVGHVARAAAEVGARLVQVSTDYVFDGTAAEPYPVDAAPAPRSVYGESKLAGETAARAVEGSLVVRTSWLFGAGGPNFVRTMVGLMEAGRSPLSVVDDQTGCPTYAPHLATALWDLVAAGARGVMHYRDRPSVTWYDFCREIARLWDHRVQVVPVSTEEFPRPAPRPAYSVLDVSSFEDLVGHEVMPWLPGLVEYLDCHRASLRRRIV